MIEAMKKEKIEMPLLNFILIIISLISSGYCMANVQCRGYEYLWLLPLCTSILIIVFNSTIKSTWKYWTFKILYSVEYLRYVLIPVFMVATGFYHSASYLSPSEDACRITVLLMCYELVIEFIVISINKDKINRSVKAQKYISDEDIVESRKNRVLIIVMLCIIIAVIAICIYRRYTIRLTILSISLPYSNRVFVLGETIINLCTTFIYFLISLPILTRMKKGTGSTLDVVKLAVLSLIWVCINVSDVRMVFITKAFTVAYIVDDSINEKVGKRISRIVIFAAGASVVAFTLLSKGESNAIFYFTGSIASRSKYASTLQEYFGGPYNVAKSIELSTTTSKTLSYLIKQLYTDLFYNVYPFNNYMEYKSLNTEFNYSLMTYATSHGQIMPIVGQGYFYFGFIFAPIFTAIIISIIGLLERRRVKESGNKMMAYFLSFSLILTAFFRMYNITIVSGYLINTVLLGMIILSVAQKFR